MVDGDSFFTIIAVGRMLLYVAISEDVLILLSLSKLDTRMFLELLPDDLKYLIQQPTLRGNDNLTYRELTVC